MSTPHKILPFTPDPEALTGQATLNIRNAAWGYGDACTPASEIAARALARRRERITRAA